MTINIDKETDLSFDFDYEKLITDVITYAIDYKECPYEAEVNVLLCDNETIHEINKEHRGIDNPTDVLSFPMLEYNEAGNFDFLEEDEVDSFNPETGELVLGDIIISIEKVYEQAEKYNHSRKRELGFLVAHSMLHLFGYDHMEPEEAKQMEDEQNKILDGLNITRDMED